MFRHDSRQYVPEPTKFRHYSIRAYTGTPDITAGYDKWSNIRSARLVTLALTEPGILCGPWEG